MKSILLNLGNDSRIIVNKDSEISLEIQKTTLDELKSNIDILEDMIEVLLFRDTFSDSPKPQEKVEEESSEDQSMSLALVDITKDSQEEVGKVINYEGVSYEIYNKYRNVNGEYYSISPDDTLHKLYPCSACQFSGISVECDSQGDCGDSPWAFYIKCPVEEESLEDTAPDSQLVDITKDFQEEVGKVINYEGIKYEVLGKYRYVNEYYYLVEPNDNLFRIVPCTNCVIDGDSTLCMSQTYCTGSVKAIYIKCPVEEVNCEEPEKIPIKDITEEYSEEVVGGIERIRVDDVEYIYHKHYKTPEGLFFLVSLEDSCLPPNSCGFCCLASGTKELGICVKNSSCQEIDDSFYIRDREGIEFIGRGYENG